MIALPILFIGLSVAQAGDSPKPPENLFGNPSFEGGRDSWRMDLGGKTAARFAVDDADAGAGTRSARLSIDSIESWGVQFGQRIEGIEQGKTYTFAVLGKAIKGPVTVRLEVERAAKPWDRAGASEPLTLASDRWTELHATFRVAKPFSEGCFAYVSCQQAHADFRLDGFRLVQGPYVPYDKAAQEAARVVAVNLYDTGAPAAEPIAGEAIAAKAGWNRLPEDETAHAFTGAAVLVNDRLALVLRRGAAGAELYACDGKQFHRRAALAPAGDPKGRIAVVSIVENGPSEVVVDVDFASAENKRLGLRYSLGMGQTFVRTEPRLGTAALAVDAPSRYLVLPDFFADDIVFDFTDCPFESAELPSENFVLHMLPGRRTLLMTVSDAREQDVEVHLAGKLVERSQIAYGKKGKVWVAILEGEGIWHEHNIAAKDAGKIVPIDWKMPFPAQWRLDWRQADRLTGSWEMVMERTSGEFEKCGWFGSPGTLPSNRKHWTTVLGSFQYPCFIDRQGQGFVQPFTRVVRFEGPAIVYPINRVRATPLDRLTVVDLVRATLGVGPCEYILDLEGQSAAMRGRATCGTRDALKAIYSAKEQKARRAEIEKILGEVVVFVKHIRSRIEEYAAFGRQTREYLASQKKDHPEIAGFLGEMDSLAKQIQTNYDKRKVSIQTPQYVVDLTERFRQTVLDDEGDDALAKCNAITNAIVVVGGNQDELVGEGRMAVKVLRQRAGMAMATDPRTAEIAKELRRRTQQVLRNAASYEAPRH
jgi:hypothetical protein